MVLDLATYLIQIYPAKSRIIRFIEYIVPECTWFCLDLLQESIIYNEKEISTIKSSFASVNMCNMFLLYISKNSLNAT